LGFLVRDCRCIARDINVFGRGKQLRDLWIDDLLVPIGWPGTQVLQGKSSTLGAGLKTRSPLWVDQPLEELAPKEMSKVGSTVPGVW
jgi:hypothetical protein